MRIQQLNTEQALHRLHTTAQGLSSAEAARRLTQFGANAIAAVPATPLWRRFARGFTHFFAVVLWIAAGLAVFAEHAEPGQGMGPLAAAIVGVICINATFSFWQEYRAQHALQALEQLLPRRVRVLRDGALHDINADALVPGDIIALRGGDGVPADCRLIESFGVQVNNAPITGESLPLARDAARTGDEDLMHSVNVLLAGTTVLTGDGQALVFATGDHTEIGKIAHLTQHERGVASPLQIEIARVSRVVAIIAGALGVLFFFIGQWLGLSFWQNLMFAIGIIVANVPEGLLPTVTLALAMGAQRMAKRNALIRHLPSVETLGSVTVICTDKTGTLTQNRMAVAQIFDGHDIFSADTLRAAEARNAAQQRLLESAAWCHNLRSTVIDGNTRWAGDPLEEALTRYAHTTLGALPSVTRSDELPFDAQRRMVSVVLTRGLQRVAYSKGALEALLPRCAFVLNDNTVHALDAATTQRFERAQHELAQRGLRVLALAYRELPEPYLRDHVEQELVLLGLIGIADPARPEVPDAIARCRAAGIRVIMVTGDHPVTAQAIARDIGLTNDLAPPLVLTGEQLKHLSKAELNLALDAPSLIFARVAPDQKLLIVQALQDKNEIVAVTGDGVNDAPALKQADIGIAMGGDGTDVAREAAHMVLLDDNFATIVAAIEEGRAVFANIRKFMTYILTSNIPELAPYLAFMLFKIPLPLTVIQILAVDLGTDMLPALALGAERPDPALMQQPPRARHARLLDRALLLRAYLFLGPLEAVAAMATFFFVLDRADWSYGATLDAHAPLYLQATSACLAAIIVMQVMNVFLCRSETRSTLTSAPWSNRLLLPAVASEIALIVWIVYSTWGNALFGTAPLDVNVWAFALLFAPLLLILEEARKWWMRARSSIR